MARFPVSGRLLSRAVRRAERGQILMMSALLLPILLGMTGMAIDIGTYANHRRSLQNAADSAALAAAIELPSKMDAEAAAFDWGARNNIDAGDMTVTITDVGVGNPNPKVTVAIDSGHTFSFIRALGITDKNVGARAVAIKTSPGGAGRVVPWSVVESVWNAAVPGDLITLKYDATNVQNGNFGAVRIDGSGSSIYEKAIKGGSTSVICAETGGACAETSPVCNNLSVCPTETGNKVSGTRDGVDWRVANTAIQCDTFAEAFTGPVSGKYTLVTGCNPWLDGGFASHRVILVPIIDKLCNGNCDVTVLSFALFFLEGYSGTKCSGNSCEIEGRFVNADVNVNALTGVYDETNGLVFTKLTE